MITVACVQVNNFCGRGAEYVNVLLDMVVRNISTTTLINFVCFTDDATGLNPRIVVKPLPKELSGWNNKLYLFKQGVFQPDERVIFLDLDTIIVGNLDDIVSYRGRFATLRDFWRPDGLGPAVWLFRGDCHPAIWEEYERAGYPALPRGDQEWLEGYFARQKRDDYPDILQDLYPGLFCSFKTHCSRRPPKGASVVCFHGLPRPHEADDEWARLSWKVGGMSESDLDIHCNTEDEKLNANMRSACARHLPWLTKEEAHERHAVIVGGGPSMKYHVEEIRKRWEMGQEVIALNATAPYLNSRGIRPDAQMIIDARQHNLQFVKGHDADCYYLSSQCDPSLYDELKDETVIVAHSNVEGVREVLDEFDRKGRPVHLLSAGSTVGLQSIALAYSLGYRKIHLYGFDSSYEDDAHHAYAQPDNDREHKVYAQVNGRKFLCAGWMAKQAQEFLIIAPELAERDCIVTVHGDGLLPHLAKVMTTQPLNDIQQEAR